MPYLFTQQEMILHEKRLRGHDYVLGRSTYYVGVEYRVLDCIAGIMLVIYGVNQRKMMRITRPTAGKMLERIGCM